MKKIFTLVLSAAGTISIAAAQSRDQRNNPYSSSKYETKAVVTDYNHQRGFDKNKSDAYNVPSFYFKEKEQQIEKINRTFDWKIDAVKMNRHLRGFEKNKQIRMLQNQRKEAIAQVQYRYETSNHHNVGFEKKHDHKW
ncbi:hypothetical protein QWZ08_19695 [Ferruginibacter paludis]|uniref:hypothetical protein n=1 Tax=Ferruginibacter paludis TaxID=1310417 RepID=UPI0025B2DDE0|nr:hypothetical protein [Ferruginibacter paludis]MDN3657886.1 hypothetical protein [Ferruginibacter paludis]